MQGKGGNAGEQDDTGDDTGEHTDVELDFGEVLGAAAVK